MVYNATKLVKSYRVCESALPMILKLIQTKSLHVQTPKMLNMYILKTRKTTTMKASQDRM